LNPKDQRTKHTFLTILILNHQDNLMRLNRVCDESVQFLVEDNLVYNKLWMEGFYWKTKHRWGLIGNLIVIGDKYVLFLFFIFFLGNRCAVIMSGLFFFLSFEM